MKNRTALRPAERREQMRKTKQRGDWSDHFSTVAADLIRLHLAFVGPEIGQRIMLRCFRRSKSDRINEATVIAVLQEMTDEDEGRIAE